MKRIVIFGNSGAGKSTLASELSGRYHLDSLDLDTLAWLPTTPPTRKPLTESQQLIDQFITAHDNWIIEGCYSDLIGLVLSRANELIFLDLPVDACIENAKNRPWEPHKYQSKAAQDANLEMLIEWIKQYPERDDLFSRASHQRLYDQFEGNKICIQSNDRAAAEIHLLKLRFKFDQNTFNFKQD